MGEYSTDEKAFKATIHNEKDVTPEFVLNEAKEMWAFCKKEIRTRKLRFGDVDGAEALMSDLRRDHKDFSTSYPVVLRYMAEMQQFHPEAFRKYLKKIAEHPWTNEDQYLDSQADYIVLLYKETHKRWNKTEVNRLRANVRAILQHEHDQVKRYQEEFKQEVEADEERFQEQSKNELAEFLRTVGERDPTTLADEFGKLLSSDETPAGTEITGDIVPDLESPVIIADGSDFIDGMSADDILGGDDGYQGPAEMSDFVRNNETIRMNHI